MYKNFLFIFFLLMLSNCGAPGAALIGPTLTGATTKSIARTSLSFGANQIIKKRNEDSKKNMIKITKHTNQNEASIDNLNNKNLIKFLK